ncbi:MAG: bifunctional diguanylate cyclase/phosphodiesterase [Rhizobiales bacterium]|nr:bifunctional diguanylate cyclase/phosphodiesterase [Hyphomicrobiales bacterium]
MSDNNNKVVVNFQNIDGLDQNFHNKINSGYLSQPEISEVSNAVGDITYYWDIASDKILYSSNVDQISEYIDIDKIKTATDFADCFADENINNRYQTVYNSMEIDDGSGVEYELEYNLFDYDRSKTGCWIEDKGKWYVGADGKPRSAVGVMRICNARHKQIEELVKLSTHDSLTGLVNRIQLRDELVSSIAKIIRKKKSGVFLLLAIDNLAMVNEAYGIDVADGVICLVAERISKNLRKSDVIGRYSGNKFGVILNNCNEEDINVAAERLIKAIAHEPFMTENGAVAITMSAGAVSMPLHSDVAQDVMRYAEEALFTAKTRAMDSFAIYQHAAGRRNKRRKNISIASEIINALNDRRVKIVYQPIVHADSGIVESYECLIRVNDENGVLIPNGDLVPIAEKLNLMRLLDHRVLEIALKKLREVTNINLAVNISANTVADSNWYDCLYAGIAGDQTIGNRLTIEITETALLSDMADANEFIDKLHALGCLVSIDDFGTGYTSFQNLKTLDIDIVKIDGTFIQNLSNNADNQFFVKTLNDLAKHFNVKTVAEWVENEQDVNILRDIGVDYLQGFYFGAGEPQLRVSNYKGDVVLGEIYQKNELEILKILSDKSVNDNYVA